MSTSQKQNPDIAWEGLSLGTLREASVPAAAAEQEALNPEAASVAESFSHPRLSPSAIITTVRLADAALLAVAALLAQIVTQQPDAGGLRTVGMISLGMALAIVLGTSLARGYRLRVLSRFVDGWLPPVAVASAVALCAAFIALWGAVSPSVALAIVAAQASALAIQRVPVSRFVAWALSSRATERRAVIVGGGGNAERLIKGLEAQPDNDIRIVALFDDRGDHRSPQMIGGCRKLGTIAELIAFARIAEIDMVIVTLPLSAEQRILSLLKAIWVLPVDIRLSAYSSDYSFARRDSALIGVVDTPHAGVRRSLKRGFDMLVACIALSVLSPVMLLTVLAIKLDSPGPVLFVQKRHGFNNRPVDVWKFRSMHHAQADPLARSIVTRGDPRVTRVGRFIRKTSIDELPQLFNVLMGDLSLVGPRPHAVHAQSSRQQLFTEIVEGYSGRHKVLPGITGWAQISGWRGEVDDPEKLRRRFEHDLFYIENWSLWLDLKILLLTPLRLLDTRNAY